MLRHPTGAFSPFFMLLGSVQGGNGLKARKRVAFTGRRARGPDLFGLSKVKRRLRSFHEASGNPYEGLKDTGCKAFGMRMEAKKHLAGGRGAIPAARKAPRHHLHWPELSGACG